MPTYLIYQGAHAEVEVPLDDGVTSIFATQGGPAVEFPDDVAHGLLEQGADSSETDPHHAPQWVTATARQIAAAKKAAATADDPETHDTAAEAAQETDA